MHMARIGRFFQEMILDPLQKKSVSLFVFRFSQLMRDRTNGRYDRMVRQILRHLRGKSRLPDSALLASVAREKAIAELKRKGTALLDFNLSQTEIETLLQFLRSSPVFSDTVRDTMAAPDFSAILPRPRYTWYMRDVIGHPIIQRILLDSMFHDIAQEYLGSRPLLTNITIWLSPQCAESYDANFYHYDNDGPGFLKFFIYLTEVDEGNGPHRYICGSHAPKPRHFSKARRYDVAALFDYYGAENEVVYLAKAGTVVAEDTSGFHCGSPVLNKYRLMLQLEYSIVDIPHEEELNHAMPQISLPGMPAALRPILRKFYK